VEQPVAADDIEGMALIRRGTGTPIAADEAVMDATSAERLLAAGAVDLLVLKPVAVGLVASLELAGRACRAGVGVVVTTMLEAGVGIAAAAQVAAALPGPLPACGLATASLLESDLLEQPLPISGGTLRLPDSPGLGVHLDQGLLARYASESGAVAAP
jgi:L-alanine-DL-glutamate epimerase-like enolase superfamily enzyme